MAYIETVPAPDATGSVRELYRRQQGSLDYLPNYATVFCHRPAVMEAWSALQYTLRRNLDERSYSLITLAAALAMRSSYCALAHAKKLLKQFYSAEELIAIARGAEESPLSPAERAMMRLADKVARDASSVTAEDIQALKSQGYSDAQVFDIVAAAAARCFFARVPDALGVQADSALGSLGEPLCELLTVGRPISVHVPGPADRVLAERPRAGLTATGCNAVTQVDDRETIR